MSFSQEQGERAVKLISTAGALREASNSQMTPQVRVEYDNEVASMRTGMDEKTFVSLCAAGRAMTMEQAIEYALQEDMSKTSKYL
ncbi:MAG TPA: hypothetical protein VNA23_09820 [Anaerolineales bacterium]|nr:hypothetical protein [Anaerolineales bacterium]